MLSYISIYLSFPSLFFPPIYSSAFTHIWGFYFSFFLKKKHLQARQANLESSLVEERRKKRAANILEAQKQEKLHLELSQDQQVRSSQ